MIYSVYYTYKKDEPSKGYIGMHGGPMKGYLGSGTLLKKAIKEFGRETFAQDIILVTEDKYECHFFEELFIKSYQTEIKYGGYNISPTGGLSPCGVCSEETKRKISVANKGKKRIVSKETRLKLSKAGKKRIVSKETRLKLSKASTGRHHTEETKKKMSISKKKMSDETKQKMSLVSKGRHHTEETKKKMSISKKNMSDETKRKIGLAVKNRIVTEETKKKISETEKKTKALKKTIKS
jgi:hypothetical protein